MTNQALLPEADNTAVIATVACNLPRRSPRTTNAQEADRGLPMMKILERPGMRLVLMDVVLPV